MEPPPSPIRLARIPVLPVLGNHEYWVARGPALSNFFARFPHLHGRRWHAVTYGPLRILALDSNLERLERLLELLEQKHRVEPGAAAERREEHLGRSHRGVVAENGRLVDGHGVARRRLNVEMNLVAVPSRNSLGHDSAKSTTLPIQ